jgi:hypothetical protein
MPKKTFMDGDALPASDLNTFLMNQTVQTYSAPGARDSALPSPLEGQVTTNATTKNLETYYGQWRPLPFAMQSYRRTLTGTGTSFASLAITFATGRFSLAPIAVSACNNSSLIVTAVSDVTTTGATLFIRRNDNANFSTSHQIGVTFIQMLDNNAEG